MSLIHMTVGIYLFDKFYPRTLKKLKSLLGTSILCRDKCSKHLRYNPTTSEPNVKQVQPASVPTAPHLRPRGEGRIAWLLAWLVGILAFPYTLWRNSHGNRRKTVSCLVCDRTVSVLDVQGTDGKI